MSWQPPPQPVTPQVSGPGANVYTQYVGTTEPVEGVVRELTPDGTYEPVTLTGNVTSVRFQAQNEATGTTTIDAAAAITESGPPTLGRVEYATQSADVAAPANYIAWWRVTRNDGTIFDTPEFLWVVQPHGVAATGSEQPVGVCSVWATNEDVARYTVEAVDRDYTPWLIEASELLYVLSGGLFPGLCASRVVRPLIGRCGFWAVLDRGHVVGPWDWYGGAWWGDGGYSHACGSTPRVRLAGRVRGINSVKLSGQVVDPTTYRVDDKMWLTRLTDPTSGQNPGWPLCQDIALPADAPGTFAVDYQWGMAPPNAGRRAAAALAWQLYLSENPQGRVRCQLPPGWTSISRQGVTISRPTPAEGPLPGASGIFEIDAFLSTYNPERTRLPAVYSRDVQPYARPYGG